MRPKWANFSSKETRSSRLDFSGQVHHQNVPSGRSPKTKQAIVGGGAGHGIKIEQTPSQLARLTQCILKRSARPSRWSSLIQKIVKRLDQYGPTI